MGTTDRQVMATIGQIQAAMDRAKAKGLTDAEFMAELGKKRAETASDWRGKHPSESTRLPLWLLEAAEARIHGGGGPGMSPDEQSAMLVGIAEDARRILERVESAQRAMRGELTPPIAPASLAEGEAYALRKGGGSAPSQGAQEPTKRRRHRAAGEA